MGIGVAAVTRVVPLSRDEQPAGQPEGGDGEGEAGTVHRVLPLSRVRGRRGCDAL